MAVYQAPDVKDRVATGDDLYTITDSGGKKKLTPSPTEVSEPGTEINRALLMPLMKAVEGLDANILPYTDYWWRRRASSGAYAETQSTAFTQANAGYYSSIIYFFYHGESESYPPSVTFKIASSVTINQSTGAVTMNNPTTKTVKYSDYSSESALAEALQSMCAGKYISGLPCQQDATKIMKVPQSAYVKVYAVAASTTAPIRGYIGFLSPTGDWGGWGPGTDVQLIGSIKQTTTGDWEYLSSPDSTAYPHSGTSGGYEYVYYGQIYSYVLNPPADKMKTANITSASYSSNKYSVDVPGNICAFAVSNDPYYIQETGEITGIIDKASGFVWYCGNEDIKNYSRTAAMVHAGNNVSIEYNHYSSGSNLTRKIAKYSNGKLLFGYGNTGDDNNFNYTGTVYLLPLK
jgi:hypothetical protein